MRRSSLTFLLVAAGVASGCGSRTSDDDLLGFDLEGPNPRSTDTGGSGGTGGTPGSGGGLIGGGPSGGGPFQNTCCEANVEIGCNQPDVQECVCDNDPFCCATEWDASCVEQAFNSCALNCDAPATGGSPSALNCCTAHQSLGCEDPEITDCVCDSDPFCCESQWDDICAISASTCGSDCRPPGTGGSPSGGAPATGGAPAIGGSPAAGGAPSGGSPASGGTGGSTNSGNCCESHGSPGCEVGSVKQCVCAQDEYCCNNQWDSICVQAAPSCGAQCGGAGSGGNGSGGSGTGGSVAQTCEDLFQGNDCNICRCTSCFDELQACTENLDCLGLVICSQLSACACN